MAQEKVENLIIVGSGPAGLTAGIYAARAGLQPLIIEGMLAGGQLTQTSEVENFPGFAEPVTGMALMAAMRAQAERSGVRFEMDEISSVDFSGAEKRLDGMMGSYFAKSVIVATGAGARWTGLPGEMKYKNKGVSACAVCDGAFFKGADVAVIGGGDTALGDALYLSRIARSVALIHRRDSFRGAKVLVERVKAAENITLFMETRVESFEGDGARLNALKLSGGREIAVTGAFVAIGHEPVTKFLAGAIELDEAGYVKVDGVKTNVEGVFAAGDCADPFYKQAVIAAGAGAQAAIEAQHYLQKGGHV
ncbi:MAG: thioredoxin-disulfide reductase [Kiritimatiellae bacterium]|nr:thioredoxin-disulfide reductase [Kiritimatiellia bacterium]